MSIGQTLRERREARSLTPEQAAYQSKVPLRLLQALESDDYRELPDPAYLLRFLHEYARLLAVDPTGLEREFREVIRRPPGKSLAVGPPPTPPPSIPWKQVLWTAVAILVVTPLVFIALSLASKRAADRPARLPVVERPIEETVALEGPVPAEEPASTGDDGRALSDRLLAWRGETSAPNASAAPAGVPSPSTQEQEAVALAGKPSAPSSPVEESKRRRFLLTARALERTWMAVRADDGQGRQVLLQKGQTAEFGSETGFVITLGNAGGVDLTLNGEPVPPLGKSGQVIRDLAIPTVRRDRDTPGPELSGSTPPRRGTGASPR